MSTAVLPTLPADSQSEMLFTPHYELCKLVIEGKTPKERIIEWLNFTKQDVIMIRSDDVLTFVEPTKDLLDYYLSIT